jgi:uncharacterized membrane protein
MDVYMVVLRIVHIVAGIFWVGSALVIFLFLQPAAGEVGAASAPLMMNLSQKRRLPDIVLGAAGLTVLAGLLMYWRVSNGFDADWIGSPFGVGITIGSLCAIAAVVLGAAIVRPSMHAIAEIGGQAAAIGAPPSSEQAARMQALQARVRATGGVILPLLVLAVIAMASARYL